MNTENYGVGSPTAWAINEWTFCANRLPCGLCRLMQTVCPLSGKTYDVAWTNRKMDITCNAEVQDETEIQG